MNIIKKLIGLFIKRKSDSMPILIIKKGAENSNVKEYKSIEDAINDLEKDANISREKIECLKTSLEKLKNKSSIKIKDGEIIK